MGGPLKVAMLFDNFNNITFIMLILLNFVFYLCSGNSSTQLIILFMRHFYFPCNRSGHLLNGFCRTLGTMDSLIKDINNWIVFDKSIKYVFFDGYVLSIKSLI